MTIYSIGFFTNEGKRLIVSVSEVIMISDPQHKCLWELNNQTYKKFKTKEKVQYLQRLCELNEGSSNSIFREEVQRIAQDIGDDALARLKYNFSFLKPAHIKASIRIA